MKEERIISKRQVEYLHDFTKKKDIIYVDLRIELVDHLCGLIEERWELHPKEDFITAFKAVYKSFGIFGFSDIASKHHSQMSKRYWREMGNFFLKCITPPRVILTTLLFVSLFFLLKTYPIMGLPILTIMGLIFVASAIVTTFQFRKNKKILNGEKNILMGGAHQGAIWVFYLLSQILINTTSSGTNVSVIHQNTWLLSTLFVLTLIFVLGNHFLMQRAKGQLLELKRKMI